MESKVDLLTIDTLSQRLLEKIIYQVNNYSEEIKDSLSISNEKFKEDLCNIIDNNLIDKFIEN